MELNDKMVGDIARQSDQEETMARISSGSWKTKAMQSWKEKS